MKQSMFTVAERIMVALDYSSAEEAERLMIQLEGIPCTMKVGMQLFYSAGPSFVIGLKERGYHVFLDLKLHDIPHTVEGAAQSITRLGVDMFNVHAAGGIAMMQAALIGVDKGLSSMSHAQKKKPKVIAVTQLTSTDQRMLNEEISILGSVEQAVIHYAQLCKTAGLDGVVASAHEVKPIKAVCGQAFLTVTPGIRLAGDATGDQSRVMTPQQALAEGTDYMVIGRSITQVADPRQRLESMIDSLLHT